MVHTGLWQRFLSEDNLQLAWQKVASNMGNKIANILKDYGERVQCSVFEANLTKNMLEKMVKEVLKYIEDEKDSVRIYRLCEGCQKKIEVYGFGKITEDEEVIVI